MARDDLLGWALGVDIPDPGRAIGRQSVRIVLVALVRHANGAGHAWPGSDTLADEVAGMSRRDVRNALAVLEQAKIITRDGKVGRAVRYSVAARDVAGCPATSGYPQSAGNPATHVAGHVAGNLAGYPATNGTEENYSRPLARPRSRPTWCGRCDAATRQIEVGPDHQPRRCPACHPSAIAKSA